MSTGSDLHHPANRLINEKSPYLLQHAYNPVDWYPWGEEAFAKAAAENKPVFLSIGYSTCHWCHVMEKESFKDEEIAALINRFFVPVKVDREERPDVDNTYMNVCQMVTGAGGWPLSIFLTPDKKPFYTATYIPKTDSHGRPGMDTVLHRIAEAWRKDRDKIEESGDQIIDTLYQMENFPRRKSIIDDVPLKKALDDFKDSFDPDFGGFGHAPKFPMAHNLLLLFRLWHRLVDKSAIDMPLATLKAIRHGGIYDQLGGGIHRYSVDRQWLVPHFEKMLYDQALLALAAVEAFQISQDRFYAKMAESILDYVLNSLCHQKGAFFCGEDADSEGSEGTYYLWDQKEILQLLGKDLGALFCMSYGVTEEGNFEGKNILYRADNLQDVIRRSGLTPEKLDIQLKEAGTKLLRERYKREHPFLDDKILTGWNGLVIAALCRAGSALGTKRYIDAARRAADFILTELFDERNVRLLRRWRNDEAAVPAFLEDYSFCSWGLIELYMSSSESRYLQTAVQLTKKMEELFSDGQNGFYDTSVENERILTRGRNIQDTALPSGASVAVLNLLRLGLLTANTDMVKRGERHLALLYSECLHHPLAYSFLLTALDWVLGPSHELVIAEPEKGPSAEKLLREFQMGFFPRTVLHRFKTGDRSLAALLPDLEGKPAHNERPTAYVCSAQGCLQPTNKAAEMLNFLKQK